MAGKGDSAGRAGWDKAALSRVTWVGWDTIVHRSVLVLTASVSRFAWGPSSPPVPRAVSPAPTWPRPMRHRPSRRLPWSSLASRCGVGEAPIAWSGLRRWRRSGGALEHDPTAGVLEGGPGPSPAPGDGRTGHRGIRRRRDRRRSRAHAGSRRAVQEVAYHGGSTTLPADLVDFSFIVPTVPSWPAPTPPHEARGEHCGHLRWALRLECRYGSKPRALEPRGHPPCRWSLEFCPTASYVAHRALLPLLTASRVPWILTDGEGSVDRSHHKAPVAQARWRPRCGFAERLAPTTRR